MSDCVSEIQMKEAKTLCFQYSLINTPKDGQEVEIMSTLDYEVDEISEDEGYWYTHLELSIHFDGKTVEESQEVASCEGKFLLALRAPKSCISQDLFAQRAELIGLNALIPHARATINGCGGVIRAVLPLHIPLISVSELIEGRKKEAR